MIQKKKLLKEEGQIHLEKGKALRHRKERRSSCEDLLNFKFVLLKKKKANQFLFRSISNSL